MNKQFFRNTEAEEREIAKHIKEDASELPNEFFENADWMVGDKQSAPTSVRKELQKRMVGRPIKENPKQSTTIRFDADILEAFKASGKGWQTRINDALREHLETNGTTLQG